MLASGPKIRRRVPKKASPLSTLLFLIILASLKMVSHTERAIWSTIRKALSTKANLKTVKLMATDVLSTRLKEQLTMVSG